MISVDNPLLADGQFIRFDLLKPEHFLPALETVLTEARRSIEAIIAQSEPRNFENTVIATIRIEEQIDRIYSPIQHLIRVNATPAVIAEYEKARQLYTAFFDDLLMDANYVQIFRDYAQTEDYQQLQGERRRYFDKMMLHFRLAGADLAPADQSRLKTINQELSQLESHFHQNCIGSTFNLILTKPEELIGLPGDIVDSARQKAKDLLASGVLPGDTPQPAWVFNLDRSSYTAFLKYSTRSDLKKHLWEKYYQKGTEPGHDNRPIIRDIIRLRQEKARLLGFNSFAELSLQTKMAGSPERVMDFLQDISRKLSPLSEKEHAEVLRFRNQQMPVAASLVPPWEFPYWSNKLKEAKFSYNDSEVREYFELRRCLQGMFAIAGELFGISLEKCPDIPVWHEDVEVYRIRDEQGRIRAYLSIDPYSRTGLKHEGAWHMTLQSGKAEQGERIPAQSGIHYVYSKPAPNKPGLLTFDEVKTLFHEFGHALHESLSLTELSTTAGTRVPRDVVEFPSTFMENFVQEKESLRILARHFRTDQPMPEDLMDRVLKSNDFNKAIREEFQIVLGMYDMTIHHEKKEGQLLDPHEHFKHIVTSYSHAPYYDHTYLEASFAHIFSGGYAAGYYSYKWSSILESDAFDKFLESGHVLDPTTGRSFMHYFLETGDSEDMNRLFEQFRGRSVSVTPLLLRLQR
jgi:oligopeptidase A